MLKERTFGRLILSLGVALVVTYTGEYLTERKEKKKKELEKDIEDISEISVIIVEVEV